MSDFYKYCFEADEMTQPELDRIALRGGVVGGTSYSYAKPYAPAPRHGYGFRLIATRGMGNCGRLVLTAKSPRAYEYLRQGKIAQLMRDFGLEYIIASKLHDARQHIRRGYEHGVIKYIVDTCDAYSVAWQYFPGHMNGVWRWHDEWNMPQCNLSAPRLQACFDIIERLGFKFGVVS